MPVNGKGQKVIVMGTAYDVKKNVYSQNKTYTVDDYNKLEDRYFEVQQTDEVNGYRCSICNTELEVDMVNEIVRLNSFVD